jgi:hypothetical protein
MCIHTFPLAFSKLRCIFEEVASLYKTLQDKIFENETATQKTHSIMDVATCLKTGFIAIHPLTVDSCFVWRLMATNRICTKIIQFWFFELEVHWSKPWILSLFWWSSYFLVTWLFHKVRFKNVCFLSHFLIFKDLSRVEDKICYNTQNEIYLYRKAL